MNKYNWEGISYPLEKGGSKQIEKVFSQLLLVFCMLIMRKYILLILRKKIQSLKNKLFF